LHRLATTDGLTGVWNRHYLEQAVAGEMARAQRYGEPLAMVMFDIDHFKAINDRHGHLVGDQVLIELALRLRGHLRASDVLARWGGEEFVVLLPHNNVEAAARLAEKLRLATLTPPFPVAGTITTSFGVAAYQPHETLDDWFTRADHALYAAKEAELAGGAAVGLGKGLKQPLSLLGGHADPGVVDREAQPPRRRLLDAEAGRPGGGELNGVDQQIGQDLREPQELIRAPEPCYAAYRA